MGISLKVFVRLYFLIMASRLGSLMRRNLSTSSPRLAGAAHAGGMRQWKLLSYLVAFPGVGLCMLNVYLKHHEHERPEFIPYEHLRLRSKIPLGRWQPQP